MNIAIASCVQLGLTSFQEMVNSSFKPKLCITLNDNLALKKSGRVFFESICKKNNVKIIKINNINDQIVIDNLLELEIEWLFVIGWSQIVKTRVISILKKGALGIHPTLLPIGRGRAPIPWAILKKLEYTGVTLFKLDKDVDNGEILLQKKIKILNNETSTSLYKKVDILQAKLIKKIIPKLKKNNIKGIKQDESKATYWKKRFPHDGEIDIKLSVFEADRKVRALTYPYPGAYIIKEKKKVIIWKCNIRKRKSKKLCFKFQDGYLECLSWQEEK